MVAADEAEARGAADDALGIMNARLLGPDGEPFWRPWRVARLDQLVTFDGILPAWATSRWILEQAHSAMHEGRRALHQRAEKVAVEMRGGIDALEGTDEADKRCRVVDRDWVYRQLVLYEYDGLPHFLKHQATPDLVAGADRIDEWAKAPMGGYEPMSSDPATVTWRCLATGAEIVTVNIGSAALVSDDDTVIGRLVPTEDGPMFETQPLVVPSEVALSVARRPDSWVETLRDAMAGPDGDRIQTHCLHYQCFLSDVPANVVAPVLSQFSGKRVTTSDPATFIRGLGAVVLEAARLAATEARGSRPSVGVDIWPCLAAAVLQPPVLSELADTVGPSDVQLLSHLAEQLSEPASTVCAALAQEARDAA
jgi:hypothetical protein